MEKECRVCLDNSGSMVHIFDGTQELDVSIAAMISEWCGYPVERGDSQPKYICQYCLKCAQTEYGRGHTHEDRHQMLYQVKEEEIAGEEVYRITDNEDRRSYLVQVKAETPEDETGETEIHALHRQVKNVPIVDEQSKLQADSEINHVINEESDEDLLEKSHRDEDIDVSQYRTTNKKRPFKCPDCPKYFPHPYDIKRHIKTHERKILKPSQAVEKSYICLHCSKRFARRHQLNDHITTHSEERPFKCCECDKTFKTKAHLKRHIRLHTEERPHRCSLCEIAFMTTSDLKRHSWTHSADRPCKCAHCSKTFQTEADLKRHSWSHMDDRKRLKPSQAVEKSYICSHCSKRFARKNHLNEHVRTHSEERPFKCCECDKAFKTNAHLKRHIRLHTEERP